ncbi:serine--tRNA ligase [Pseudoroseomonas wenyumeiae]|uniref:Serine--tRNA ligase n=1 Tax=Teichococcus wenyumeiae TaxID=2478470 RepID=A0A3A9JCM6_9PROT|nr:serine--tRNA ligase [Pseudoroseomonas wenyumeiae]RKK04252.1 serine--tRNA ligase [Pseudoroseomonas wenyumeiae]RMI19179.1 serine--tRNA ligase [Pseudoroseomonas wenyumeiae]
MHDTRIVRADPAAFDAALARRALPPAAEAILEQDNIRRAAQTALQELQARRNQLSKEIGIGKRQGADTAALEAEATALRGRMEALEAEAKAADAAQTSLLETLPNLLDDSVPEGREESDNVVLHQHGNPPNLPFTPKQHFEIGEALGLMDFAGAAKLAGARFTVLKGQLARLERALGQYMLSLHVDEHGFTETSVPLLVNDATMYGTGQLPKFKEDLFHTDDGRWLIPTAEVPLTNLVAGEILAEDALPVRLTSLSPCFRSEAGSAGRDTRGMLRQHQFTKVEMVSITTPEQSEAEHERMTQCAERVLTELGLVWRRIVLCAGDTGFSATKTYDLEVWLPGQAAWREISSCSNCRDFQARRMGGRYRPKEGKGTAFLHTLNGSGVAVGRALIAVLETHQQEDGRVAIPAVLAPWMGGLSHIG